MNFVFRNLWRRKGRTFLTIFGIVVGIFALTVLGGLSARLNQQVNSVNGLFAGFVMIGSGDQTIQDGMRGQMKFLSLEKARELETVEGVKGASGLIMVQLEQGSGFSAPEVMAGYEAGHGLDIAEVIGLKEGRQIQRDEVGKAVLGSEMARKLNASVGGTVQLKGRPFEVVGIMNPTLSMTDTWALVPYRDALAVFQAENPMLREADIAQTIIATPADGVDPEVLAKQIPAKVPDVKATSPEELKKTVSQMTSIFNAIILGIAFIALFVGGLSVINTMIMTVSERTHEIGLKKSIGAKTKAILGEYLFEACMLGLIAGVCGMLAGLVGIWGLNRVTHDSGITMFTVSATVVAGPVVFATVLGAVAGFFPAMRAARLNPVDALKED